MAIENNQNPQGRFGAISCQFIANSAPLWIGTAFKLVATVNVLEQYVLSNPYGMVHFFLPLRGARQLCAPLTAQCGLAEQVYQ
jgi:hypothetical protein